MNHAFTGVSAEPVTTQYPFFTCNSGDQRLHLFEVAAGVPISQAIHEAGCILANAFNAGSALIQEQDARQSTRWMVLFQLGIASALIDSILQGIENAKEISPKAT